jgi:branched-chain amino acid transport system ATP-binding protein
VRFVTFAGNKSAVVRGAVQGEGSGWEAECAERPLARARRDRWCGMTAPGSSIPLLSVRNVVMRFGGVVALGGVSFDVERYRICGLIGPNGSGKTTLFNCISGIYRHSEGDILFNGQSLTRMKRHRMAALGIGRTFQNVALFRSLSVRENVLVGAHHLGRSGFVANALRLPLVREEERRARYRLGDLLHMLDLENVAGVAVGSLPFPTQKRVELARALIGEPSLLLLDEPAGGLNHAEVDELAMLLERIREPFNLTILLVEHHMSLVMRVSEKVVALEFGRKIAHGSPDEVRTEPEVIRAYLGETEADTWHAGAA